MTMSSPHDVAELCCQLEIAASRFAAVEGPIWSSYGSGPEIAQYILSCLDGIRNDTATVEQKKELWGIFAPTCDWDDIVGEPALGEAVFQMLNNLYWQDIHNGE
jgi:hypothetical protein